MARWSDTDYARRRAALVQLMNNMISFVQGLDAQSGDPVMTRRDAIRVVRSYQEGALTKMEEKYSVTIVQPWRTLVYEVLDELARRGEN